MKYVILGLLLITCIILITMFMKLSSYYSILRDVRNAYGVDPENEYDERSYTMMSSYFRVYPIKRTEQLDSQTWKDLQMDIVFNELDHTKSNIGSEYMYRYMRNQSEKDLDRFEADVQYFMDHAKEREKLLYCFQQMKAVDGLRFIDHLKDPTLFRNLPTKRIKLFGILSFIAILLIPLIIVYPWLAIVVVMANLSLLIVNQSQYMANIRISETQWDLFYVLGYMMGSVKQLMKFEDPIFNKSQLECKKAYSTLSYKIRFIGKLAKWSLLKRSFIGILPAVSAHFGLYGWAYDIGTRLFKDNADDLLTLYDKVGYYEMIISHASYRETLAKINHPTFVDISGFDFEEMIHPLIKNPVANSKQLASRFLITGANASGKTTFARTLLLNIYLSQQLNICFAKKLRFRKAKIYSSIAIEDDLMQGNSFYMVEIKRLKYFLDIAKTNEPAIFFLDEILKGTNTKERIAAASTILDVFATYNCSVGLTTHDIELSSLLEDKYQNYHFKEEASEGMMHYDYLIYDGATKGSNAIALLEHCDYDIEIVNEAQRRANLFDTTGTYKEKS